tara:strand:+ start:48 stop:581 length:534 start_codon:yes stop_codon:yes gene_type:complete
MDTHIKLNEIAFQNLRVLRNYVNHLTDNRYIKINNDIELEFLNEMPDDYIAPTHSQLAPVIYFTFNQSFNVTRCVPYELSATTLNQIRGLHSLMDRASSGVGELIDNIENENDDSLSLLEEYLEDINIKLDIIYERNVNISRCQHMFAPFYNTIWGVTSEYIKSFFVNTRKRRTRLY